MPDLIRRRTLTRSATGIKTLLVLAGLLALPQATLAQDASGALEEIVVTANKREQNLQDVSTAITAFSAEDIDRGGIIDITRLESFVPGLRIGASGSEVRPALRGARTNEVGVAGPGIAEQTVGIFLDGIYVPTTTAGLGAYLDVERIEVLRGPQGTLYGRNTFAGSINVITNQPEMGEFSGSVKGLVGDYDRVNVEAVLNIPLLGDRLATRLVVASDKHDGLIANNFLPGASDDLREKNLLYVRSTTRWDISEDFSATLRFDYSDKDQNSEAIWGYQQIFGYQITPDPDNAGQFLPNATVTPGHIYQPNGPVVNADGDTRPVRNDQGPYDVFRNAVSFDEQEVLSTTIVLDWATDFADVKLTANYYELDGGQFYDNDYSDGGPDFVGGFGRLDDQKSTSIDLQLTSPGGGGAVLGRWAVLV